MSLFDGYAAHGISREVFDLSEQAMERSAPVFSRVADVREARQLGVIRAFSEARVSESGFMSKTGYGYDDLGRDQAEAVFAHVFGSEDALVRLQFSSGTHVLATCLRALLAPGDDLLIATGTPYDTIIPTMGEIANAADACAPDAGDAGDEACHGGAPTGRENACSRGNCPSGSAGLSGHREKRDGRRGFSLSDRGVSVRKIELLSDGSPDCRAIVAALKPETRVVYIQKSRGYSARRSLLGRDIRAVADAVRGAHFDAVLFVDNCYGEFVEDREPSVCGADLVAGSLIKNPGAGIAPCGGYIAGRRDLLEEIGEQMTAAGVGRHVGPQLGLSRLLLEGLYFAPTVTAASLMGAVHAAALFESAGFDALPHFDDPRGDIVQALRMRSPERLKIFCRAIQSVSPVDAFAVPEPAPMPGYDCDIIMASGSFIQGSTIELSADGPLRPPYDAFLQGGLTFENARLGAMKALEMLKAAAL